MGNNVIFTRTNITSRKMTMPHCFRRQKSHLWQNTVIAPYAFWRPCQQPHCSQGSSQHGPIYLIDWASKTCKTPDSHEQICKGPDRLQLHVMHLTKLKYRGTVYQGRSETGYILPKPGFTCFGRGRHARAHQVCKHTNMLLERPSIRVKRNA